MESKTLAQHELIPWRIDGGRRIVAAESAWREPLRWNQAAEQAAIDASDYNHRYCGDGDFVEQVAERPRVFCASMADVFEDWDGPMTACNGNPMWWCYGSLSNSPLPSVGLEEGCRMATMQDIRERLFDLIEQTPNLDWLLLTKRPENIAAMIPSCKSCETVGRIRAHCPHCNGIGRCITQRNIWLGTTVENQATADERIPHLLRVPARVRFLSCEPLLGPINLIPHRNADGTVVNSQGINVDWVIAGGESGPHARPSHPDWFRSLQRQCTAAGVPFFFKQWGEYVPGDHEEVSFGDSHLEVLPWHSVSGSDITPMVRIGKNRAGRLLDGREWNEVPQ